MVYIIMGVTGSGKTTIGQLLAERLGLRFYDGDDYHSQENVAKMKEGRPLTDGDRAEWLRTLANHLPEWQSAGGAVLACSALKEKYRDVLRSIPHHQLEWIFLMGSPEMIKDRLRQRKGHFMNPRLLDSQFEILEEPGYGIKVSVEGNPSQIVDKILETLPRL